jgi:hypothetical protein
VLNANTGANYSYQWQFNGTDIPGATASSHVATAVGDYTVTITDNSNNQTAISDKIAITIVPPPSAQVTASGALTYCTGNSLTLSTPTGNGLTYQWQLNGNNISGATDPSYAVTSAGGYTVTVTNIGCATTSSVTTVSAGPLSISLGEDTSFCESLSTNLVLDAGHPGASYTWSTGEATKTITANASGAYWVEVNAGPGCIARDTVQVNISPLPKVSGISYTRNGNTFFFNAGGATNVDTYLWLFSDGGSSTDASPTHTFAGAMTDVKLIVMNACGTDTMELQLPLNVDNVTKGDMALNLYPNPASDKITIAADGEYSITEITIVNQVGQVLHKEELNGNTKMQTVDVSRLPVGHYILRAGTTNGNVSKPFIIAR